MPNLTVSPQSVLLTAGQPVTFLATLDDQPADDATWSLSPSIGTLGTAAGSVTATGSSVTYVAPSALAAPQTVALLVTSGAASASARISLTADSIAIIPAAANLKSHAVQQFVAVVASPSPELEDITWILSPPVGKLDQQGVYTAPTTVTDSATLTVTAKNRIGKQAHATINLTSDPWRGPGVYILGVYLLFVFSLVIFLVGLMPLKIQNVTQLKADRADVYTSLQDKLGRLQALSSAAGAAASSGSNKSQTQPKPGAADTTPANKPDTKSLADVDLVQQLKTEADKLQDRVDRYDLDIDHATSTDVQTRFFARISREIDLLLLVILAGALGSFLHMAQSFSDFAGNQTLKSSWNWWYALRPFVGSILALLIYAVIRGGLITAASLPAGFDASGFNPYGLIGGAALAGMFSKAATQKLGDVFDTLFQSSKAAETKDKLTTQTQSQQPSQPQAGTSSSSNTNAPR